jgi:predicted transposase YdaD
MQQRPSYDQALKRLITQDHDGFLSLVMPDVTWQADLSSELPDAPRLADFVWQVKRRKEQFILHIELQTKVESDIGGRMALYAIRIWEQHKLPVYSVVVFLRPAATMPTSPFTIACLGEDRLTCKYDIIKVWEHDPSQILSTTHYALWPLAGLMGQVTPESTLAIAEQIVQAPLSRHEKSELTGLLVVLAGARIDRNLLLQLLRGRTMIDDIIKESSFYEVVLEEGIEKGIEKGRAEGQLDLMRQLARDALAGRFGALDEALADHIGKLTDMEVLRRLILDATKFPDLPTVIALVDAAMPAEGA